MLFPYLGPLYEDFNERLEKNYKYDSSKFDSYYDTLVAAQSAVDAEIINQLKTYPKCNSEKFSNNETNYVLECVIPGVKKEDVAITVDSNMLFVKTPNFKYEYTLYSDADVNSIEASLDLGILSISIKKLKKSVIKIQVK
jgi:HSP20 family molecular chaperone IbpA